MDRKQKEQKWISPDDALKKLQQYCAYRDRCHKEVRSKLLDLGVYGDTLEEIIIQLIEDRFLDEERFARSFARGKFRINKWGKVKIKRELKFREISDYCLRKAMEEIDDLDYLKQLEEVILQKNTLLKEPNLYKRKSKLATFVINKGYESPLAWNIINEQIKA
ncbi:MAG: regulatory protein RecX [Bacteroidota bacterium]